MEEQVPPLRPFTVQEAGMCLLELLYHMYFAGADAADGSKMKAAIFFCMPEMKADAVVSLRIANAVTAWGKRSPAEMRVGMPEALVYGIIGAMVWRRNLQSSLVTACSYATYGRPGEVRAFRCCDVNRSRTNNQMGILFSPASAWTARHSCLMLTAIV
jgi:hypothetical protein